MSNLRLDLKSAFQGHEAFEIVKEKLGELKEKFVEFAKESLKAYAEEERVMRQLKFATGELSEAFEQQAKSMQMSLGVSDDMVVKMQMMLYRFGEAPDKIQQTVKALLDYSTVSGEDAIAATSQLLSGVESGRRAFKDYGLELHLTGKASADVMAYTDAMAKKFGGASDVDADSLAGKTRRAHEAIENLHKEFGAFLVEMESKLGVMEKIRYAFEGWVVAITGGDAQTKRLAAKGELYDQLTALDKFMSQYSTAAEQAAYNTKAVIANEENGNHAMQTWNDLLKQRKDLLEAIAKLDKEGARPDAAPEKLPGLSGKDRTTHYGEKMGAKFDAQKELYEAESRAKKLSELDDEDEHRYSQAEKDAKKLLETILKSNDEAWTAIEQKHIDEVKDIAGSIKDSTDYLASEDKRFLQIGEQLGSSLMTGLANQIRQMKKGGKFDIGEFMLSMLPTALTALTSLVPGAAAFAPLISGVSNLITAAAGHHQGGWIGVPRYHVGGWPGLRPDEEMAVLQQGEHVLSRGDVAAMGGPQGVQQAKRGGPTNISIQAVDAQSFRDMLEGRSSRAFYDAMRTGRGSVGPLFGV